MIGNCYYWKKNKKNTALHYCNLSLGLQQSHNFIANGMGPCSLNWGTGNGNAISRYKCLSEQNHYSSDNVMLFSRSIIIIIIVIIFIAINSHKVKKRISDPLCADHVLKFQGDCVINAYCAQRHVPILHMRNISGHFLDLFHLESLSTFCLKLVFIWMYFFFISMKNRMLNINVLLQRHHA